MSLSYSRAEQTILPDCVKHAARIEPSERRTQALPPWQAELLVARAELGAIAAAVSIRGPIDSRSLSRALQALAARHQSLGSTFGLDADGAFYRIDAGVPMTLSSVDLTDRPGELDRALEAEVRRNFDVVTGPLARATLFRLASELHVLLFTAHATIADAHSLDVLLDEVRALYDAERTSTRADLPEPSVHWSDYLQAQASDAAESRYRTVIEEYRAELSGREEALHLPIAKPRPAVFNRRAASVALELEASLVDALERLASEHHTTVDVVLYTGFTVLLARYSGQSDLVTALGVANRAEARLANLVAPLANAVVVRSRFEHDPQFTQVLAATERALRSARSREDVPVARVAKELDRTADPSRSRLYQARFSMQPNSSTSSADERWSKLDLPAFFTDCDLALVLGNRGENVAGRLEYASHLFDAEAAHRFGRNFETLLRGIVANPERAIQALSIIHDHERSELAKLNATRLPIPAAHGFDELIRRQAERTPDRVAIVAGADSTTYAEIERRSSQLAHLLVQRGVERGTRVGVAVARSSRLLEATLGIVKAGAAYVPLDPDYPAERLAYMVQDACMNLIVTESALCARLPAGGFETLLLDESTALLDEQPATAPAMERAAQDVAYVIYTSGSTGRPKGVQVPHGAIVNFLISMAKVPGCSAEDRLIALTTLSFDIAVLELFLPLTVGARTIIAGRECLVDGAALAALLSEHDATVMQATPTTWQLLLDAGWTGKREFKALCGGEAFPRRLARELIPRCESVWNMYGPTETTVWSTCERLTDPDAPILVGRPIANTQTYVLDGERRLVPFGVAGELYIGGHGVTVGYLERPELTAERFVLDTLGVSEDARLYRTGDLARQWPHGLELIGRVDNQVKLRGHRIELGEIEAVVEADHQVQRAAVVVREFGPEDCRLVAYLTRAGESAIDEERVRAALRERLPGYMVPRHFVELERMPLTPNGKIDRKALPIPETLRSASDVAREMPENAIEAVVLEVWRRVLRVDEVGVTDDFFDIGGHSLLAFKLVQGINEACQTSLPLGFAFEFRTIRVQAESVNQGQQTVGPTVVPLAHGEGTPLFCICGIRLYQTLARHIPGRPVYGIFVPAEQAFFETRQHRFGVREMASEYVQGILSTRPRGPYYIAGISFGGTLAYEVAQQLRAAGHEVGLVALLDVVLDEEFEAVQNGWTIERLVRIVERGPTYWAERARALLARSATVLRTETRSLESSIRRRIPALRGEIDHRAATRPEDQAAELEHLHRIRSRQHDLAETAYRKHMRPYQGSVLVFKARDQDRGVLTGTLTDDLGWAHYVAPSDLECHTVPGDHLGILDEPNVGQLAGILRAKLSELDWESTRELAAQ